MADLFTNAQVGKALKTMGRYRVAACTHYAAEGPADDLGGHHLLALGLRESFGRNVLGDHGRARGVFQIHERYHYEFLRSQPGCRAGDLSQPMTSVEWQATESHLANEPGFVPRFTPAMVYALGELQRMRRWAMRDQVPREDARLVALSAYNQGYANAYAAWRAGDPDAGTTGGDYASWVMATAHQVYGWLNDHPLWKELP